MSKDKTYKLFCLFLVLKTQRNLQLLDFDNTDIIRLKLNDFL